MPGGYGRQTTLAVGRQVSRLLVGMGLAGRELAGRGLAGRGLAGRVLASKLGPARFVG